MPPARCVEMHPSCWTNDRANVEPIAQRGAKSGIPELANFECAVLRFKNGVDRISRLFKLTYPQKLISHLLLIRLFNLAYIVLREKELPVSIFETRRERRSFEQLN